MRQGGTVPRRKPSARSRRGTDSRIRTLPGEIPKGRPCSLSASCRDHGETATQDSTTPSGSANVIYISSVLTGPSIRLPRPLAGSKPARLRPYPGKGQLSIGNHIKDIVYTLLAT